VRQRLDAYGTTLLSFRRDLVAAAREREVRRLHAKRCSFAGKFLLATAMTNADNVLGRLAACLVIVCATMAALLPVTLRRSGFDPFSENHLNNRSDHFCV
jgi:hypothetical protein